MTGHFEKGKWVSDIVCFDMSGMDPRVREHMLGTLGHYPVRSLDSVEMVSLFATTTTLRPL